MYDAVQRDAVINTVTQEFPLNLMYWAVRDDGGYEIIDGQQRTISICQYVTKKFSFNKVYFDNQSKNKQDKILNYKLMIYFCSGTYDEKLDWFKTINIAGVELADQELRNAVYSGLWVTNAKRYFSKTGCPAYDRGSDYLTGTPIRQDYLETAIKWLSDGEIEDYMGKHQHAKNADALWKYFESVMDWLESTFTKKRSFMKGVAWGPLYNQFKDTKLNAVALEKKIAKLEADEEVTNSKGIYPYILSGDKKHLSLRVFDKHIMRRVTKKQGGKCKICEKVIATLQGDYIKPWSKGGKTIEENCQMLCVKCNIKKSNK